MLVHFPGLYDMFIVQSEAKLESQLFKLYHTEMEIHNILQEVKGSNKDLEKKTVAKAKAVSKNIKNGRIWSSESCRI